CGGLARPVRTRDDAGDGAGLGPPNPLHASGGLGPVGVDGPRPRADRTPEEPETPGPRAGTVAGATEDARDPAHLQRTSDYRDGARWPDGDGERAGHLGRRRRLTRR